MLYTGDVRTLLTMAVLFLGAHAHAGPGDDFHGESNCDDPALPRPWIRNLHWAVRVGEGTVDHRAISTLGLTLLAGERVCYRRFHFEHRYEYARRALVLRLDHDYSTTDRRHGVRPALEVSVGENAWGWLEGAVSAGPMFDRRGVGTALTVGGAFAGISLELRYEAGISWEGHQFLTMIGLSNAHLSWDGWFRPAK